VQIKGFYSQYLENFLSRKESSKKVFEKEIREYEELAGWKSKNYLILRDTCEKFRKKVNRIAKKYEEILEESIDKFVLSPFRENLLHNSFEEFIEFLKHSYISKRIPLEKAFFQYNFGENSDELLVKAHKILRKCSLKLSKSFYSSEKVIKSIKIEENAEFSTSYEYLNGIIELLFTRIEDLKKENVTKLMKFRALQDLYKILKDIGLTSLYKTYSDIELIYEFELFEVNSDKNVNFCDKNVIFPDEKKEEIPDEISWIQQFYNRNPVFSYKSTNSDRFTGKMRKILEKIEGNYYKILDRISVLRTCNEFHADIALLHIRKGMGFVMEMFYSFRSQYKKFSDLFENFEKIKKFNDFFNKMQRISKGKNQFLIRNSLIKKDHFFINSLNFFEKNYDNFTENKDFFIENNEFLQKNDEILRVFLQGKTIIQRIFADKIGDFPDYFLSSFELIELLEIYDKIPLVFSQMKSTFFSIKDLKVQFIITDKMDKIQIETEEYRELLSKIIKDCREITEEMTNSEGKIEEFSNKFIGNFQLNIQSISKLFMEYKQNIAIFMSNEENTEKTSFLSIEMAIKSRSSQILKHVSKEIEEIYKNFLLKNSYFSSKNSEKTPNFLILTNLIIILEKFNEFSLNYHAKFLSSFSKLSSIISIILSNVFYKGFCHKKTDLEPEKNDENTEENTEFMEGTGIGEGEGKENVSKEIEFEEQVLGEKGEKPDENPKKNDDISKEKEEGIDMENDFEGENFEENKEENEKNSEENKEENKEEDDEFSDVDKEIDYDLWNKDDFDENSEENEGKKERDLEDLQLNAEENPINSKTETKAKKPEIEKENKRNLKEFDQNDEEKDFNEENDEKPDEKDEENDEEFKEEKSDENGKRMGDAIEEEEEENNDKMSLEFDDDDQGEKPEENEENQEENQEENLNDPLDQKENKENNGENDENSEEISEKGEEKLAENIEEISEEDIEEISEENPEELKTAGLQSKENKEKAFGREDAIAGNQEIIEENGENKEENAEGKGKEGGNEMKEDEKFNEKKQNSGFSDEFYKQIIEHTSQIYDKNQMESFLKDLNVVNEKNNSKDSGKIDQELNKMMEFEAMEKKEEKEEGFITNLPNLNEENYENIEENEEKHEEKNDVKKNDFAKNGKENQMEIEENKEENQRNSIENIKKTKKKEQKNEENSMKFESKKSEKTCDFSKKIDEKIDEKNEEIAKIPSILGLLNKKKTQEERKIEIVELIKEWKKNSQDYDKSLKVKNFY